MDKNLGKIMRKVDYFSNILPRIIIDGKEVFDFREAEKRMAVLVFVFYQNKILLVQRSPKVSTFPNKWHVVSGYYDEYATPDLIAKEELNSEVGILEDHVEFIKIENMFKEENWFLVPVYVFLKQIPDKFKLNWENEDANFFTLEEALKLNLVSRDLIQNAFKKISKIY